MATWGEELTHRKDPDAGKDWRQEERGTTEDEIVGWHHQLSGYQFEHILRVSDGQGSLACCSPWGRKESDMTERLNWTEVGEFGPRMKPMCHVPKDLKFIKANTARLLGTCAYRLPLAKREVLPPWCLTWWRCALAPLYQCATADRSARHGLSTFAYLATSPSAFELRCHFLSEVFPDSLSIFLLTVHLKLPLFLVTVCVFTWFPCQEAQTPYPNLPGLLHSSLWRPPQGQVGMFTQSPSTPSGVCCRFPGHRILCTNGPETTFKALGYTPLGSQVAKVQLFVSTWMHPVPLGWECVGKPTSVRDNQEWEETGLGCRSRTGFLQCQVSIRTPRSHISRFKPGHTGVSREEDSTYLIWQWSVS